MKSFAVFSLLVALVIISYSEGSPVLPKGVQCPAEDVGNAVFFPDPTDCRYTYSQFIAP